jgi:hypothetical protein
LDAPVIVRRFLEGYAGLKDMQASALWTGTNHSVIAYIGLASPVIGTIAGGTATLGVTVAAPVIPVDRNLTVNRGLSVNRGLPIDDLLSISRARLGLIGNNGTQDGAADRWPHPVATPVAARLGLGAERYAQNKNTEYRFFHGDSPNRL